MRTAERRFTADQRQQINQAVAAAEAQTGAEIVPVVATASGRYDRAEDLAGLWLGAAGVVIVWALWPEHAVTGPGEWGGLSPFWEPAAQVAALVLGFLAGAFAAGRCLDLRRLFTSSAEMAAEVASRSRQVFFDSTVHHTAGATGVLVYVSLYERRAAVLADRTVLEAVGQETLDAWRDTLVARLHAGDLTAALCETIQAIGDRLASALPARAGDVNELGDALVLLPA